MSATLRPRWLQQLSLWLILVTLVGCAAIQPTSIEVSPNDDRAYRHVVLENNLEVLLVSDPDTDKAAAAMDVNVGSREDSREHQGLAHFLEHMLFLGTAKYPKAGEYQEFISQHGGSHNAYTGYENTNYFFDIQPDFLEPALDRFAQQFVAPLFTPDYVAREKNAVHSEFTSGARDDSRRYYSALKEVINPSHPFSTFSVGNLETLADRDGKSVRDAMLEFYDRYYSANRMHLVIYGKEDLDTLERYARGKFAAIPNQNREVDLVDQPIIKPDQLPALLTVEPIMDRRTLSLLFPLPPIKPHYRAKPDYYISNLIGHEGEGSLLSWLKQQGWADSLSSGMALDSDEESVLSISITLTADGLQQYQQVVRDTFAYIDLIRSRGVDRWRFEEQAKLLDIAFRFQEKADPIHYASYLASRMQHHGPDEVIRAPYRMDDYDPALYKDILSRLTPDNVLITLMAKGLPTDRQTQWYKTDYSFRPLTDQEQQAIRGGEVIADIHLPGPNPFIPEELQLIAKPDMPKPVRLPTQENLEAWYALDTSFGTPRANFYLSVRSPHANATPRESVLTELFVSLAEDKLNEFAYPASLAGLSYNLYKHMRGFTMRIEGYDDKQKILLETILDTLTHLEPAQERFDIAYDNLRRRLENAQQNKPYERTLSEVRKLLLNPYWTEQDQLAALEHVKLQDLKDFIPKLLGRIWTVSLVHGNLSESEALAMNELVAKRLSNVADFVPVERARVVQLNPGTNWYQRLELSHNDTGFTWLFQGSDKSYRTRAQYALLAQLISAPYYQEIRTQRQLGYVVFASPLSMMEVPGLGFVVQSPTATSEKIKQATEAFLKDFAIYLEALPEEAFRQHRQALVGNLLEQPKTLVEKSERYWINIDEMNFDFDTMKRIASEVKGIEKTDLGAFFEQQLLAQPTSLLSFHQGMNFSRTDKKRWQPQNFNKIESKSALIEKNGLFPER